MDNALKNIKIDVYIINLYTILYIISIQKFIHAFIYPIDKLSFMSLFILKSILHLYNKII